jgi:hypothetical protein
LGHIAGKLVLVIELGTDAEVNRLFGLLLARTLFEAAALASKPQLDDVVLHATRRIL